MKDSHKDILEYEKWLLYGLLRIAFGYQKKKKKYYIINYWINFRPIFLYLVNATHLTFVLII